MKLLRLREEKLEIVRGLVTEFSLDMLLKIIKLARSTLLLPLKLARSKR